MQCLFETISYLRLVFLTLLTCGGGAFFPYRKRYGKDNVILSDLKKPSAHVFHSGKIWIVLNVSLMRKKEFDKYGER